MRNRFYSKWDKQRSRLEGNTDDFRSTFQIDRDRILHTAAFRGLQNKTQVFWAGEYDFYRTRLTHSLEVAQVGRSIAHWLQSSSDLLREDFFIDADLIEACCLSHDLGHPPFGHAGEKTLNKLMGDYGGFEGNAQTLRLLTETIFSQRQDGMNPSRAFADSILKYKTLWSEAKHVQGKNPSNHFLYDPQHKYLDWVLDGNDFPADLSPGDVRDEFKSIECAIMDWADDTAYCLNDLADSYRAGFLSIESIEKWAEKNGVSIEEGSSLGDLLRAIRRERMESFIGMRIGKYIQATTLESDVNFMSAQSNRYAFKLLVDDEIRKESKVFKKLAYEVVFLSPKLKQLEHKGCHLLERLWSLFHGQYIEPKGKAEYELLPRSITDLITQEEDESKRARLVCDYIAGMTDGYAVRTYRRLFDADYGSIGDVI